MCSEESRDGGGGEQFLKVWCVSKKVASPGGFQASPEWHVPILPAPSPSCLGNVGEGRGKAVVGKGTGHRE